MVLELHELGYQLVFKNFRCQRQVPRWTKKKGYSSSPSSSTPKSGRWLIISQTVLLGQIFLQLMLMGHFGLHILENRYTGFSLGKAHYLMACCLLGEVLVCRNRSSYIKANQDKIKTKLWCKSSVSQKNTII